MKSCCLCHSKQLQAEEGTTVGLLSQDAGLCGFVMGMRLWQSR